MSLDPAVAGEIREQRPAVLFSNDAANKHLNRVQVVPLTSNISKVFPSQALLTIAGQHGKAMAGQLTTVSKLRLINCGGALDAGEIRQVDLAIKIQLGLR